MNRGRLLRLHRRTLGARNLGGATLEQLKDARRPLLFSLMPRMLRHDGWTANALQNEFRYIENNTETAAAATVSPQRWKRALATSRKLFLRRTSRGG